MLTVTKKFEFEAAHFLKNYQGNCFNLHGHTFKLEVTIGVLGTCSDVLERELQNGMLFDFKKLKKVVQENIIDIFDHNCLNNIFPENPTCENMVLYIIDKLKKFLFGKEENIKLFRVRLYETSNSYCEWSEEIK